MSLLVIPLLGILGVAVYAAIVEWYDLDWLIMCRVCQRYMDDDEVTFEEVIATRGVNVAALEIEVLPSKWDLVDPQELRQLMALVREMRVRRSMIRLNKQYVQVTKGLFLGSKKFARKAKQLHPLGVVAVLDCTCSKYKELQKTYAKEGIRFLGLSLHDELNTNMMFQVKQAVAFCSNATRNGAVMVNCKSGRNVSPALVAAFLILCRSWPAEKAVRQVMAFATADLDEFMLRQLLQLAGTVRQHR